NRRNTLLIGTCHALGLALGILTMAARAQEAPATPAPAPAATAAAPAPAPDPTTSPAGSDSTGAAYTAANATATLTGDKDPKTGKIDVNLGTLTKDVKLLKMGMNIFWTLVTGFLVMFMQAGFALLETGLTRAKNAAHTMAMNIGIYGIGMMGFWICGF